MQWIELSVQADSEAVESVTEVFSRFVHGGVAIEEDITTFSDRDGYVVNTDKPVTIRGYLPADDACGCAVTQVRDALGWLGLRPRPPPPPPPLPYPAGGSDRAGRYRAGLGHRLGDPGHRRRPAGRRR